MTEHRSDDQPDNSLGTDLNPAWRKPESSIFSVSIKRKNEVLLVMNEPRPWDGSELRLHELQEKFNAYVSFLLDGEMIGRASGAGRQASPHRVALCGNAR